MIGRNRWIGLAGILAVTVGSLAAQGSFTPLGSNKSQAWRMSGDGSVVVGFRDNLGPVFRWTAEEGTVDIGGADYNVMISKDGKTIVCSTADAKGVKTAAIWQGGTTWKSIGGLPNGAPVDNVLSSPYAISGDGSVIVGLAYAGKNGAVGSTPHAFRWDAKNGMVDLGSTQNSQSRANAISASGNVIAGWDAAPGGGGTIGDHNYWMGAVWYGGLEQMMHPYGWTGPVSVISEDGTVMAGQGHPLATKHSYVYTASDGVIEDIGALVRWTFPPPEPNYEDTSYPNAISDDGRMVVGISGYGFPSFPQEAFIWTPATKMVRLKDYLLAHGVPIPSGWQLVNGTAISSDKKTIAGFGLNPNGMIEGFVAKLPRQRQLKLDQQE